MDVLLRLAGPEREGAKTVYVTDFEPEFLRRSGEFYKLEAVEQLEKGDAAQYLRNVSVAVMLGSANQLMNRWSAV